MYSFLRDAPAGNLGILFNVKSPRLSNCHSLQACLKEGIDIQVDHLSTYNVLIKVYFVHRWP